MDQEVLVDTQIEDGKRLIDRLVEEGVAVTAACWVKEGESGRWYLYIASNLVDESGATKAAYRRVNELIRKLPPPFWIDKLGIKVIRPNDPLAQAVLAVRDRRSGRIPTWVHGNRLGEVAIEEAYVYPPTNGGR